MTRETMHARLIDQPPDVEHAGKAELFLRRLLKYEEDFQLRHGLTPEEGNLHMIAEHISEYLGDLDEDGSSAIQKLTERIERAVHSRWNPTKMGRLTREAVYGLTVETAVAVTRVAHELTQAERESDIDIRFLYEDPLTQGALS